MISTLLGGWKAWAIAGAVVVAVGIAGYVKGRIDGASICDGRLATAAAEYNAASDKAMDEARARMDAMARGFAEIDSRYTKGMSDAQNDLDRLRADVAAGRRKLRLAARCPAAAPVPDTAGATGLGDAAGPELGPDAVEAYHDLRAQHERVMRQVPALQELLRQCLGAK